LKPEHKKRYCLNAGDLDFDVVAIIAFLQLMGEQLRKTTSAKAISPELFMRLAQWRGVSLLSI
jgi:hypothetical protein